MSTQTAQRIDSHLAEETAVRALYEQLMDGWNDGGGEAFAAPFAEDGDLIGFDGTHLKGRHKIARFHQRLFGTYLKGTRFAGRVKSVRFVGPDVALVHALGGTLRRGKSTPSPKGDSIQTLVAVRRGGEWRIAAFQNTQVRPMGRNVAGTFAWFLFDWLWRVFRPRK
jgi:uncharacterized protein (TIGR02246 family)